VQDENSDQSNRQDRQGDTIQLLPEDLDVGLNEDLSFRRQQHNQRMAKFETKDKIGDRLYQKGLQRQQMKERYIEEMRQFRGDGVCSTVTGLINHL
jgi:hypothetical protein